MGVGPGAQPQVDPAQVVPATDDFPAALTKNKFLFDRLEDLGGLDVGHGQRIKVGIGDPLSVDALLLALPTLDAGAIVDLERTDLAHRVIAHLDGLGRTDLNAGAAVIFIVARHPSVALRCASSGGFGFAC